MWVGGSGVLQRHPEGGLLPDFTVRLRPCEPPVRKSAGVGENDTRAGGGIHYAEVGTSPILSARMLANN